MMKRTVAFQLFLLSFVCFFSCSKIKPEGPEQITVAIYDGTPQMEYFTQLLNREWTKAGHKEELRIVPWDNYAGLPEDGASLLIYDGVFYSALRAKGCLQPLSSIPGHYSFEWTYTLAEGDKYVAPFLLCSSFLIFDKDDAVLSKARYVTDITQETAVPLRSMCAYYYISNMIAKEGPAAVLKDLTGNLDKDAMAPVRHMYDNWLGSIKFENASFSKYDGLERFNSGAVKTMYNFSETSYDLTSRNLSVTLLDPFQNVVNRAFNVDYMSVRKGVSKREARLCEELIAIISSESFQYEYLDYNGDALYCMPANKDAFVRLAARYPLYSDLYKFSSSDTNCPMVLGPDFYEQQDALEQKVRSSLTDF